MTIQYELVLATDLDGTFLEGNHQIKKYFYNEFLRLRERIMLVYTTGRPIEAVEQLCKQEYLPNPEFIIGDHGTHIVDGTSFQPIEYLQKPIIQKWNNSNNTLKDLLRNEVGIQLQPLDPPYRVAYYYDPKQLQSQTLHKITNAGFDAILSCDMYLDIVPQSVNKGSSLINLLNYLNINTEITITCGDSLNDLSLFQTGLKSIAVGNSEPKLLTKIKSLNLNNVYNSNLPGILGIIDGLHFYGKSDFFIQTGI